MQDKHCQTVDQFLVLLQSLNNHKGKITLVALQYSAVQICSWFIGLAVSAVSSGSVSPLLCLFVLLQSHGSCKCIITLVTFAVQYRLKCCSHVVG